MDSKLLAILKELDIDETNLEELLSILDDKQLDCERRLERTEDEDRKKELDEKIQKITTATDLVKVEVEKAKKAAEEAPKPEEKKAEAPKGSLLVAADEEETKKKGALLVADDGSDEKKSVADKRKASLAAALNRSGKGASKSAETAEATTSGNAGQEKKPAGGILSGGKTEEQKAQEQHEKELKKQVEELKAATAKKKKEEEAAKKKAEAQANAEIEQKNKEAAKASEAAKTDASKTGTPASSGNLQEYQAGMMAYKNKQFNVASEKLIAVCNKGTIEGVTPEEIGMAEYTLGHMYQHGEGVTKDVERGIFWYKRAIEHGNSGCGLAGVALGLYYCEQKPTNAQDAEEFSKNAFKYFQKAAEAGSQDAKLKYINLCEQKAASIGSGTKNTGIKYCKEFMEKEPDPFLKQKWEARIKAIKKGVSTDPNEKPVKKKIGIKRIVHGVFDVVGIYYLLLAVMYLTRSFTFAFDTFWAFDFLPEKTGFAFNEGLQTFLVKVLERIYNGPSWQMLNVGDIAGNMLLYGLQCLIVGSFVIGLTSVGDKEKIFNLLSELVILFGAIAWFSVVFLVGEATVNLNITVTLLTALSIYVAVIVTRAIGSFAGGFVDIFLG